MLTIHRRAIDALHDEIRDLYLADSRPWIVGFSGGKDSTATLQLVWNALSGLDPEQLSKPVHVISTDTGVENPVVAAYVGGVLDRMSSAAEESVLPIRVHALRPALEDSFWVSLIGRGYAAPRRGFRWCTDRLKIRPSSEFMRSMTLSGTAILILGTRKAESAARRQRMIRLERRRTHELLSPSPGQPGILVYSPIEEWNSDDVWWSLMAVRNPWGADNKRLLGLYSSASDDSECPIVLDASQSKPCGTSRFGCWTCTMVSQDRSMAAMAQSSDEYDWLFPLLHYRDEYLVPGPTGDRDRRDYRRMRGPQLVSSGEPTLTPGPYLQSYRATLLMELLRAQEVVRGFHADIELITLLELEEIRRIWVEEKGELEDLVPRIYADATGRTYPGEPYDLPYVLTATESDPLDVLALLEECCDSTEEYETARSMLAMTHNRWNQIRRRGLYEEMEGIMSRWYDGPEDALATLLRRREIREEREDSDSS